MRLAEIAERNYYPDVNERGALSTTFTSCINFCFIMADINQVKHPVILFDGVCNLCSSIVKFVIKRDSKNIFQFASLQSDFGNSVLQKFTLPGDTFNTFILFKDEKIYTKSTGALLVAKQLSGALPLLYVFIILPSFIRNGVYDVISSNRYRWFGRKKECWIPSPELKNKFLY